MKKPLYRGTVTAMVVTMAGLGWLAAPSGGAAPSPVGRYNAHITQGTSSPFTAFLRLKADHQFSEGRGLQGTWSESGTKVTMTAGSSPRTETTFTINQMGRNLGSKVDQGTVSSPSLGTFARWYAIRKKR